MEEARQARAYWRRRGLDDKTINRFGLGYAPDDGQALYQHLRDKGYNQAELDAAACSSGASRAASTACSGGGS